MRQYRMKRQRESEIAMGDALEGDFRKAMRTLASAVSIVSTAHDDRRFGMTATAVCSLSVQPPTLLVCVNQSTSLHHPLLSAGRFCINILHADQDELARMFGRKGIEDRFASGNWQVDDRGVPFVADAQASIFCTVEENLRPPNALHRRRRGLPGGGARGRPSAALSRRTIYRRPCRGRRLGHSDRSLKLETARSKKRTGLVAKAAPQGIGPRASCAAHLHAGGRMTARRA